MRSKIITLGSSLAVAAGSLLATAGVASAFVPPSTWSCDAGVFSGTVTARSVCFNMPSGHGQRVKMVCQDGFTGALRTVFGPYVYSNGAGSDASCNQRESVNSATTDGV